MPLYFFDIVTDGHSDRDTEGTDLPDTRMARLEATRTVGEMIRCAAAKPFDRFSMQVRDEHGNQVTALRFDRSEPAWPA